MPAQLDQANSGSAEVYLRDVQFAIDHTWQAIDEKTARLRELRGQLKGADAAIAASEDRREHFRLNPELDDEGLGTSARWDQYFELEPARDKIAASLEDEREEYANLEVAMGVLCGSLFQIVRQGISKVFGGPREAPVRSPDS